MFLYTSAYSILTNTILETIRCYPGQPIILRQCVEDFKIPDSDTVIEKGITVFIPRYGLNHDPEYYPNPDTYDPEHFSDEAKADRHPYAHLLFGDGPRKCLGRCITQCGDSAILYNSHYIRSRHEVRSNARQTSSGDVTETLRVHVIP